MDFTHVSLIQIQANLIKHHIQCDHPTDFIIQKVASNDTLTQPQHTACLCIESEPCPTASPCGFNNILNKRKLVWQKRIGNRESFLIQNWEFPRTSGQFAKYS